MLNYHHVTGARALTNIWNKKSTLTLMIRHLMLGVISSLITRARFSLVLCISLRTDRVTLMSAVKLVVITGLKITEMFIILEVIYHISDHRRPT